MKATIHRRFLQRAYWRISELDMAVMVETRILKCMIVRTFLLEANKNK